MQTKPYKPTKKYEPQPSSSRDLVPQHGQLDRPPKLIPSHWLRYLVRDTELFEIKNNVVVAVYNYDHRDPLIRIIKAWINSRERRVDFRDLFIRMSKTPLLMRHASACAREIERRGYYGDFDHQWGSEVFTRGKATDHAFARVWERADKPLGLTLSGFHPELEEWSNIQLHHTRTEQEIEDVRAAIQDVKTYLRDEKKKQKRSDRSRPG